MDIYNNQATLDAEYNWWGTNFTGTDLATVGRVSGALIFRWLVLNKPGSRHYQQYRGTSR
ncbi:hypothetical protein [Methanobacterium formicicum]|uniref:hypothetical protein n=1 Tax=Methanobacterium formicicum TaxID=2162 RepID=UPI002493358A|nr:hypothetical protein [Methanobacterium formicicum]